MSYILSINKGKNNIKCYSKVLVQHMLPGNFNTLHLGINSTNFWNCSEKLLPKDIYSVNAFVLASIWLLKSIAFDLHGVYTYLTIQSAFEGVLLKYDQSH